jgi:hypothetical protein
LKIIFIFSGNVTSRMIILFLPAAIGFYYFCKGNQ